MLDDAYLNGYARILGAYATVVYLSLCRHADKEQSCFASQKLIAQEHNIGERTVRDKMRILEEWNIIKTDRVRGGDGKWLNNTYFLVDKDEWKKPEATVAYGSPEATDCNNQRQPLPHKETHIKETHINPLYIPPLKKYSSIKDVTEKDFGEIAERYQVSLGFVKLQYETLVNYCESKGKVYKNYKSALRNFVLGDMKRMVERRQDDTKRGVDLSHLG